LLRYAIAKHPHVARIVLSGQGRGDSAQRSRELCHRFLEKPCPAEEIEKAIAWAIARPKHVG
jgi:DNA-binding NtrC family response regulator